MQNMGGGYRRVAVARDVRLGSGLAVPYPEPSSPHATAVGRGNRRTDTKPERALRSELHQRGLRFRKDHLVKVDSAKARVDICFPKAAVAVFIDGCFWHMCPEHGVVPKSNTEYWIPKLRGNVERDQRVTAAFAAAGWTVLRFWEHVPVLEAADLVEAEVRGRHSADE
jgi:DNA mismatch endonuclease, patch repair protein